MYKNKEITKQTCLPLSLNYKKLQQMPTIGIFGNSGSGKTFALKSMVEEILLKMVVLIFLICQQNTDKTKNTCYF